MPLQQALRHQQVAFNNFFAKRARYPRFKSKHTSRASVTFQNNAQWYGRELVVVDRWFPSSKLCSARGCGHVNESMPLSVRSWTCPACGASHDRDVNAAANILAAGLVER